MILLLTKHDPREFTHIMVNDRPVCGVLIILSEWDTELSTVDKVSCFICKRDFYDTPVRSQEGS